MNSVGDNDRSVSEKDKIILLVNIITMKQLGKYDFFDFKLHILDNFVNYLCRVLFNLIINLEQFFQRFLGFFNSYLLKSTKE